MLPAPPCYYKGIDDDGLYRWFGETIESSGPDTGHYVLYNIPAMTQVDLTIDPVTRIAGKYPDKVIAVKDRSGN